MVPDGGGGGGLEPDGGGLLTYPFSGFGDSGTTFGPVSARGALPVPTWSSPGVGDGGGGAGLVLEGGGGGGLVPDGGGREALPGRP